MHCQSIPLFVWFLTFCFFSCSPLLFEDFIFRSILFLLRFCCHCRVADDVRTSLNANKRIYMKPVNKFPRTHPLGDRKICGGPKNAGFISHEGRKILFCICAPSYFHPVFFYILITHSKFGLLTEEMCTTCGEFDLRRKTGFPVPF